MTEQEIRQALEDGKTVRWKSDMYKVFDLNGMLMVKAWNHSQAPLDADFDSCYIEIPITFIGDTK